MRLLKKNSIMHEIEKLGFSQLLHQPTHILGGLIDHCYVAKNVEDSSYEISQKSVYFTDHDIIEIRINQEKI